MSNVTASFPGTGTFIPSNFVTPGGPYDANPNWTQTESAQPASAQYNEPIHDRLMTVMGYPTEAIHFVDNSGLYYQNVPTEPRSAGVFGSEGASSEITCKFLFDNLMLNRCTGLQLETIILQLPPVQTGGRSLNLTQTLCGDFISDSYDVPRRWVWSSIDPSFAVTVGGTTYSFDLSSVIPSGRDIGYYSLSEVITYLLTAWTNFMKNRLGDASFTAFTYVDRVGVRIFFSSTTYGRNSIRLLWKRMHNAYPNAVDLLLRHFSIGGVTADVQSGYTGESFAIFPRASTGFQNNATFMTIHSNELTQFRKADSLAPANGHNLIGVCTTNAGNVANRTAGTSGDAEPRQYSYRIIDGSMTTPKVFFDKTQSLSQFEISLTVASENGSFSEVIKATIAEIHTVSCIAVFRLW